MREESWVEAHVHAFSFFDGSVPVLVPDDPKRGPRGAPSTSPPSTSSTGAWPSTTAARPFPLVRASRATRARSRWMPAWSSSAMAPLRGRLFTSLPHLNKALPEKVRKINTRPFKKREGGRDEVFIRQEKPLLVPLPGKPYETVARKTATVNFNHRVAFDGSWYSVPFSYARREADARATESAVRAVCDGERIAMRRRLHGRKDPIPRTPTTCPMSTATSPSGTAIASADGRGRPDRHARP